MKINQTVGHGTDVLSLKQYHTVLAFRLFGLGEQYRGIASGAVSLLDIKPTVLALVRSDKTIDSGLLPVIRNKSALPMVKKRHIFLESDFTPEAIRTVYPDMRDVILEGIQLFQIDPITTRLSVKKDMQEKIIHSKQYADIYDEWLLALYPQVGGTRMPILVDLRTGEWSTDLSSLFAQASPAQVMLSALQSFYGDEIGIISVVTR